MLVYGDGESHQDAGVVQAELVERRQLLLRQGPGLQRHADLVATLIRLGQWGQGLIDREAQAAGGDHWSALHQTVTSFLVDWAAAVGRSWDSQFTGALDLPAIPPCPDGSVMLREAEGYAFYALYPESYWQAARRSGLGSETMVIGIRSIGTSLGAMVAAALGSTHFVTLRPTGHPFQRHPALDEALAAMLLEHDGAYAIVDEGPGLSGSSFNGIADWLADRGVVEDHIHFFPSHHGDLGPEAAESHRRRWQHSHRHVVGTDALLINNGKLQAWLEAGTGASQQPLEDISGGGWRRYLPTNAPLDAALERRKFIHGASSGAFWLKFAGLGDVGQGKAQLATLLHQQGFGVGPVQLLHGFVAKPFHAKASPLSIKDWSPAFADLVADYLVFRAGVPPMRAGASLHTLFDMAAFNIAEAGGADEAAIRARLGDPQLLVEHSHPCAIDGRMRPVEWLRLPDGRIRKTDALDHGAAHDLVGAQDITWDIAGTIIAWHLDGPAADRLFHAIMARLGRPAVPAMLNAMRLCYIGFELGLWSFALARAPAAERDPIARHQRYLLEALNR